MIDGAPAGIGDGAQNWIEAVPTCRAVEELGVVSGDGRAAAFAIEGAIARRADDARAPNAMTATNAARPRRAYGGSLNFKGRMNPIPREDEFLIAG